MREGYLTLIAVVSSLANAPTISYIKPPHSTEHTQLKLKPNRAQSTQDSSEDSRGEDSSTEDNSEDSSGEDNSSEHSSEDGSGEDSSERSEPCVKLNRSPVAFIESITSILKSYLGPVETVAAERCVWRVGSAWHLLSRESKDMWAINRCTRTLREQ